MESRNFKQQNLELRTDLLEWKYFNTNNKVKGETVNPEIIHHSLIQYLFQTRLQTEKFQQ